MTDTRGGVRTWTAPMRSILTSPCMQLAMYSRYPWGLPSLVRMAAEKPRGSWGGLGRMRSAKSPAHKGRVPSQSAAARWQHRVSSHDSMHRVVQHQSASVCIVGRHDSGNICRSFVSPILTDQPACGEPSLHVEKTSVPHRQRSPNTGLEQVMDPEGQ